VGRGREKKRSEPGSQSKKAPIKGTTPRGYGTLSKKHCVQSLESNGRLRDGTKKLRGGGVVGGGGGLAIKPFILPRSQGHGEERGIVAKSGHCPDSLPVGNLNLTA